MDRLLAFFAAVDQGDQVQLARLLVLRPQLVGERIHGATALHRAAARGDLATLGLLLERGAGIDEPDESGSTALSWATDEACDAAVDFLLDHGAQASAVDLAARGRCAELARLLDEAPWTTDQRTAQGTALHAAIRRGRRAAAELLLARGALPGLRDEEGFSAFELAQRIGDRELCATIERALAGTEVSLLDAQASEALSYRCAACSEEIVIEVDRTEGDEQRLVEDCPVCCRANVIEVRLSSGGNVAKAELE